jgi:predicted transcriptional regulator
MLTDGKQIAAARQLLGWSQTDLATRAGVSKPSIVRLEADLYSVKHDIQTSVVNALANDNIEFIDGGTRVNKQIVQIIEGENCYLKLLDNVYETFLQNGEIEVLKSGVDERRSSQEVTDKVKKMRKDGVSSRSLIKHGQDFLLGPIDEYRWMNDDIYTESDVKLIYADKVAYLMSWYTTYRVLIIQDEKVAEENRRLFNFIWKISDKPTGIIK